MNEVSYNPSANINNTFLQAYKNDPLTSRLHEEYSDLLAVLVTDRRQIPSLSLLHSCQLFKGNYHEAIPAALASELFHYYKVAHTAAMDQAIFEDNNLGHKMSSEIIKGDLILIMSYSYFSKTHSLHIKNVVELFNYTAEKIINGCYLKMEIEENINSTVSEYLYMVSIMSAEHLSFTMKVGAMLAGATDDEQDIMYAFGKEFGLYISLKSDWEDAYGEASKTSKILNNQRTYLQSLALELANDMQKEELAKASKEADPKLRAASILSIYEQLGIREKTENSINAYYNSAFEILGGLQIDKAQKDSFVAFINQY